MYRVILNKENKVSMILDMTKAVDFYTTAEYVDFEQKPELKIGDIYQANEEV